jgi:hypothetical protein
MGEAAVSNELRPILASHLVIRRIEDVLFQLRVQLQLGKDLLRKQMLGAKIPGALISAWGGFVLADSCRSSLKYEICLSHFALTMGYWRGCRTVLP